MIELLQERFLNEADKAMLLGKLLPAQAFDRSRWNRITYLEAIILLSPAYPEYISRDFRTPWGWRKIETVTNSSGEVGQVELDATEEQMYTFDPQYVR